MSATFTDADEIVVAMSLNEVARVCHDTAKSKGFYDDWTKAQDQLASRIALIHSEASKALKCIRNGELLQVTNADGKPTGLPSELADIVIRVFDLASVMGYSIGDAILQKMAYNETRPRMHGGKAL